MDSHANLVILLTIIDSACMILMSESFTEFAVEEVDEARTATGWTY